MQVLSRSLAILGLASALPEDVLSNEQIAQGLGDPSQADKIAAGTGVRERHIAPPGTTASDLAVIAAQRLFGVMALDPATIDFVIFCSESPDYLVPPTACTLQHRLQLPTSCAAFDVNLGCSGWVYSLGIAQGLLSAGLARQGLLLTADTMARFMHPRDRATVTLFGDAATATLVGIAAPGTGLSHVTFGTDGAGARHLIMPAGGARLPRSAETAVEATDASGNVRSQNNVYMNGPEILSFTLGRVPRAVRSCLAEAGVTPEDIDLWVFHQASEVILTALQRKFAIPPERMALRLADVGNTIGSAVPLALERALQQRTMQRGQRGVFAGFGVGLSWATALYTWGERTVVCPAEPA